MRQMNKVLVSFFSALALFSCSGVQEHSIEISSEEDLAGLRVATLAGSCYEMQLSPRKDISLQLFNSDSDALQSLINGKADVVVEDEVVFNTVVRRDCGIKIALLGSQRFPTAFMVSKENQELVQAMNAVQHRMIEDGSMETLKDFWLTDRYTEVSQYTHIPEETSGTPIRVATISDSAPLSFRVDGEWYGIEIDLLRELAKELHRPLEIKRYDSGSSFLSIKSGVADILCGAIFVTPERELEFSFSEPYHSYHSAYFVQDREAMAGSANMLSGLKNSIRKNLIAENRWKYITSGLWETIKISVLAILLGSVLGIFLYAMDRSRRKWLRAIAGGYNWFMAGIPELVLLLIMFYVVFAKVGLASDLVAVITFSLFFASGVSRVYATSLDSVPYGQTEAGLALGFTHVQTFFLLVLPQAVRRGLPLYKGQCISLLKGSSIVGYIAIQDLTRAGDIIRSRTFDALVPLAVVTILYFLLVWLLGLSLQLVSPKKKVL